MRLISFAVVCGLLGVLPSGAGASDREPTFADFPASSLRITHPVRVRTANAKSRKYASVLLDAAEGKPDFARHYTLANWGCGASCVMVAAIDAQTGKVAGLPFTVCCWPIDVSEPLTYHRNSRLLVVHGRRDEKGNNGAHYYRFDGVRFTPIAS